MPIVTDENRPHLASLISLDETELEKLLSFTLENLKKGDYPGFNNKNEIQTKVSQDFQKIIGASISLYNIARFSRSEDNMAILISELRDSRFSNSDIGRIKKIIAKMDSQGLTDQINDYAERRSIENLVLPRLTNILITSNYRIASLSSGRKELVPMVQCAISMAYVDTAEIKQFEFQFTPGELDQIIQNFQGFRNNMQKDTEFAFSRLGSKDV